MKKKDPLSHIPPPSGPTPRFVIAFLRIVAIVSPLLWILISLAKAIHSGYSDRYLTDPGHKRVRIYDELVMVLTLTLVVAAFAYTYDFSLSAFSTAVAESPERAILVAQFANWESFLILYVLSVFLYFYDTRRERIIQAVNRHHKVW